MKISVIGLGKLGLPLACCLAKRFDVIGVDVDSRLVNRLIKKEVPYYEKSLETLLGFVRNRIMFTNEFEAIKDTDISFVIVPTPSQFDGSFSIEYVEKACLSIADVIGKEEHIIAINSTVNPGDTSYIQSKMPDNIKVLYNPEFIALGDVIQGLLAPDFILIGEEDKKAGDLLIDIYRNICINSLRFARMNFVNAEITKISVNTYITGKISFANTIARLCEKIEGGDVVDVVNALGMDRRINPAYMLGGLGYGGTCFPRDNRALAHCLEKYGVLAAIPHANDKVNKEAPWEVVMKILKHNPETVGILGLTYKPDTNITEESQAVIIKKILKGFKKKVFTYDPALNKPEELNDVMNCDIIVIATPWKLFKNIDFSGKTVIDCWRLIEGGEKLGKN